jgi:hypothetical protein
VGGAGEEGAQQVQLAGQAASLPLGHDAYGLLCWQWVAQQLLQHCSPQRSAHINGLQQVAHLTPHSCIDCTFPFALSLLLVLLLQLVIEERMLLERYGQVYQDYKAKITKKFFPFVY